MARKLPPLNALKAFEAAARHQSLVKAAAELNVTHAAISRHVRQLEQTMRVVLFERTGRGVVLTEAGAGLARELTKGFDLLASATGRFSRSVRPRQRLVITSDVPIAINWLVPRLGGFSSQHPNIDLVLDPTHRVVDLIKEEADLGLRYGAGSWRGVDAVKLADVELIVVCSPGLLKRHPVPSAAHLPAKLMIQEQDRCHWTAWLQAAGITAAVEPRGPTLLADSALAAAEAGQGFVLTDRIVAADALQAGRLVMPVGVCVAYNGYYLVSPAGKKQSTPARNFSSWLYQEMQTTLRSARPDKRRPAAARRS